MICILDKNDNPLNPIYNNGLIRMFLKEKKAKIVRREPFLTIKLLEENEMFNQSNIEYLSLGIDSGYKFIGFSIISLTKEIVGGELELRNDIKSLITTKKVHRNLRRNRLRYRKAKFNNRKRNEKWLAPSLDHKYQSHLKLVNLLTSLFPINKITIETASFDIQKINNPDIKGIEYQHGQKSDFNGNNREFVLARDNYECQNPNCKNKSKILHTHHIIFQGSKYNGSNALNNLITLCSDCNDPKYHKPGEYLHEWCLLAKQGKFKNIKEFKAETFMSIIRNKVFNEIKNQYPTKNVRSTFGYLTKEKRHLDKEHLNGFIEKSHRIDAFYIAGGSLQSHEPNKNEIKIRIEKRNNRSLKSDFRDSKWIDIRTGETVTGNYLKSGRTSRNKNENTENLRKYRSPILKKNKDGIYVKDINSKGSKPNEGIRKQRHVFQKGDLVLITTDWQNQNKTFSIKKGQTFIAGGVQNKGERVLIYKNGKPIILQSSTSKKSIVMVPSKICEVIKSNKGFVFEMQNKTIDITPLPVKTI